MSLTYILVALAAVLLNNVVVERLNLHTRITTGTQGHPVLSASGDSKLFLRAPGPWYLPTQLPSLACENRCFFSRTTAGFVVGSQDEDACRYNGRCLLRLRVAPTSHLQVPT